MGKIGFVTDSTAYLHQNQVDELGIRIVPLSVVINGKAYSEGVDISNAEFYTVLPTLKELPTTSQPSVGQFKTVFEEMLQNYDDVLCLTLSANLSGTFQSAQTAAEMVNPEHIKVVDSRISSFGIAGPLLDGVELARRGASVQEILDLWEYELSREQAYFVVDTLEFLHKGGRIGGAAAIFGSLLQIKPILTMVDGKIDLFEKVRTHRRAMDRIWQLLDDTASNGQPLKLGVIHSARLADANALRDEVMAKYPHVKAEVYELGPVVGTHTGPQLLSFVFHPDGLAEK